MGAANLDATAKAAIAAVDKAAKDLPPEEQVKFSILEDTQGFGGNDGAEPENHGQKVGCRTQHLGICVVVCCRGECATVSQWLCECDCASWGRMRDCASWGSVTVPRGGA